MPSISVQFLIFCEQKCVGIGVGWKRSEGQQEDQDCATSHPAGSEKR